MVSVHNIEIIHNSIPMLVKPPDSSDMILNIAFPKRAIVLGRFSSIKDVKCNDVEIVRRLGGGGTVYLDHNFLVIEYNGRRSLHILNMFLEATRLLVQNLIYKRVDITPRFMDFVVDDRKIAGTSIAYMREKMIIGISVILRNQGIEEIERCLKVPEKQPSYRRNRSHRDFLISAEAFENGEYLLTKTDLRKLSDSFLSIFYSLSRRESQ